MKYLKISCFIYLLTFFIPELINAQYFGKNKVQYSNFHWRFLQSEHFDVYFTDGGFGIAEFTANTAEKAYESLRKDFQYDLMDRIIIIVHNSHNDFGQTNVDLSLPEESIGGFTEFFKNRVVVPFEGDWEKFRHVVHHELTHAIMLQMVYGVGVQSIVTGLSRMPLPLWFIEGLAEFESRGWDVESDMFMRDATLNSSLPDIDILSYYGYMAYKGGQSVLYFLSEKYGEAKIGEILSRIKINKSSERGLKKSIGVSTDELTESWHKYLKQTYWPDIENRMEPRDTGKRLTNHKKWGNFININPAISPKGDQIAFLSDKSDYFDIYLMNAMDGRILSKLVSGQRTGTLEELHWLKGPSISWSPNGQLIIFTAKAESGDRLNIVDVKKKKIVSEIHLDLDGIYNPTWNPQQDVVAFIGIKKGQSDIYCVDLTTKELARLTEDIFCEAEPSWSPDGARLVFASDRGPYLKPEELPGDFKIYHHDFKNYDIYELDIIQNRIRHLIENPHNDRTPVYSPDGRAIAFTSDRSGITNLYLFDLKTAKEWPITNILTCALQPSWSGNRLAFTSFYERGYDIYVLNNPLDIQPGTIRVEKTDFMKKLETRRISQSEVISLNTPFFSGNESRPIHINKFRAFIFDEKFASGHLAFNEESEVSLPPAEYRTASGEFKIYDYRIKFSPDIVNGSAGYNQYFGIQGSSQLSFSDVMGNHRINVYTNFFYDFRNSDYMFSYFYLPHRVDIGLGGYHNAYFFWSYNFGIIRDRNWGFNAFLSRPFNRYQRLDLSLAYMGIDRSFLEVAARPSQRRIISGSLNYVKDTSVWGITGPMNGTRSSYGITYSPGIGGDNGIDFLTLRLDQRSYFKISNQYSFAVRFTGAYSDGENPQRFFLGGVPNWINRSFFRGIRINDIDDIYFACFETPLRGADYYQLEGNRFSIINLEFRFPLIQRLLLGWPLPLGFQDIRGALFADLGTAWYSEEQKKLQLFQSSPTGGPMLNKKNTFMGYGFSIRTHLGIFLLNIDFAWPTNLYVSRSRKIYWSLGASF